MPDHRAARTAFVEPVGIILDVIPIAGGAVHEMVQAGAFQRVITGPDPHETGDVRELADLRIGDVANPVAIGVIPEAGVLNPAALPDLAPPAEQAVDDLAVRMDQRRICAQSGHEATLM